MLIYLDRIPGSSDFQLQSYVFQVIAGKSGWFITDEEEEALFHFRWINGPEKISIYPLSGKIFIDVPTLLLKQLFILLQCQDSSSPDEEPPPLERPTFDETVSEIQKLLSDYCLKHQQLFIHKLPWPEGKRMALALTHDVDMTRKYGIKHLGKDLISGQWGLFQNHYRQSVFQENIYWNFDEILQFYQQHKFKSTFFFLARAWEKFHYRYQIRASNFRKLFEKILQQGHEIALHSSRYAFSHPARILKEKNKLEKIIGQAVTGVRQHYLRLQFPKAWQYFTRAGFKYDSSCGYNNSLGFRAGTSTIFPTFDYQMPQFNSLREIPISLMDYPWSSHFHSLEKSRMIFDKFFKEIEKFQGVMNILWHPSNLAEPTFREVWNKMFEWISVKEYYLDTLSGLDQWQEKRAGLNLLKVKSDSTGIEFSLSAESSLNNLYLAIISGKKIRLTADLKQRDANQYQLALPQIHAAEDTYYLDFEEDTK